MSWRRPVQRPALAVVDEAGRPLGFSVWCPWCEQSREFSAREGDGDAVPCQGCRGDGDMRCPEAAQLVLARAERSARRRKGTMQPVAKPDAPMALPTPRRPRQRRLREVVEAVAPTLAAAILGEILGPPVRDGSWQTTIVGYFIAVEPGAASWRVIPPPNGPFSDGAGLFTPIGEHAHDAPRRGHGLIGLLSALYGVPAGVAAVRLLEAVMGCRMDSAGALDVADQIERWRDRGGRGRRTAAQTRQR